MKVKVEIAFKDGILDPQAKAISHALGNLGFDCVKGLRVIKTIELDLDIDDRELAIRKVQEMSDTLLANPVIEIYNIELLS